MKKLLNKNYSLLISFLILISGMTFLFFYLSAERKKFSLEIAQSENKILLAVIFSVGILSLSLNLVSVYKTFCEQIKIFVIAKLLLLNFPLMLVETILVWGGFIVSGWG